jgi:heme A synthase
MSAETVTATGTPATDRAAARTFTIVIGLAALTVLLQGLWAGLFIHEGQDYKDNWVQVHARGAEVAIVLTLIAVGVAVVKLRHRKDLVFGSAAFAVLLIVESYIGGLIGDKPNATIIHLPLAMALMALAVWLPLRARVRVDQAQLQK